MNNEFLNSLQQLSITDATQLILANSYKYIIVYGGNAIAAKNHPNTVILWEGEDKVQIAIDGNSLGEE